MKLKVVKNIMVTIVKSVILYFMINPKKEGVYSEIVMNGIMISA